MVLEQQLRQIVDFVEQRDPAIVSRVVRLHLGGCVVVPDFVRPGHGLLFFFALDFRGV